MTISFPKQTGHAFAQQIVFSVPSLVPDRAPVRPAPSRRTGPPAGPPGPGIEDGDVRKLATIMEMGEALAGTLNLQAGLYGALEVLERRCGARARGDRAAGGGERAAGGRGLAGPAAGEPGALPLGEGITGGAPAGAPAVVPRVSRGAASSPRARTGAARRGTWPSSACPSSSTAARRGTLRSSSATADRDLERMIKVLRIAAGMISQSLRIQRLIGQERERLVEENTQLRQELQERYEFTNLDRQQRADAAGLRAGLPGRRHRRHGADPGRERHRQGADRARAAPPLAAGRQAVRPGQLRRAARDPGRDPSCSATSAARSPARRRGGRAGSSWPTAARSSSTRSAS